MSIWKIPTWNGVVTSITSRANRLPRSFQSLLLRVTDTVYSNNAACSRNNWTEKAQGIALDGLIVQLSARLSGTDHLRWQSYNRPQRNDSLYFGRALVKSQGINLTENCTFWPFGNLNCLFVFNMSWRANFEKGADWNRRCRCLMNVTDCKVQIQRLINAI